MVPDAAASHYELENQLLVLPESVGLLILDQSLRNPSSERMDDSIMLMLLFPESPSLNWKIVQNTDFLHFNDIALRFNPNSSGLWKLRRLHALLRGVSDDDIDFLEKTSFLRPYNYHLFNYWLSTINLSIMKPSAVTTVIDTLVRVIKTSVQNFSGYHLVLKLLRQLGFQPRVVDEVLNKIRRAYIIKSDAFTEFIVTLAVELPESHPQWKVVEELCTKECDDSNPFKDHIKVMDRRLACP